MCEDTKGVIASRQSKKDRQAMVKKTNNDIQNNTVKPV